jgi:hypothetical protein
MILLAGQVASSIVHMDEFGTYEYSKLRGRMQAKTSALHYKENFTAVKEVIIWQR